MKKNFNISPATPVTIKPQGQPQIRAAVRRQTAPPTSRPIPRPTPPHPPSPRVSQPPKHHRPAALDLLLPLLGVWLALALLATGCVGPQALRGGKAFTTRKPAGNIEQTLVQGQSAAEASRQQQERVNVRTYTVPAGSRIEASPSPGPAASATEFPPHQPSTLNSQPSAAFVLSAPMPVVEREESRASASLGAAQKDTARELGAKLSSLKGIVWVGAGLFLFGLASLVWPPLKLVIASVTTSAALMLGGVALMVLPTMVVGNELLILGIVALVLGAWFLAHRHGHLRGTVTAAAARTAPTPQFRRS